MTKLLATRSARIIHPSLALLLGAALRFGGQWLRRNPFKGKGALLLVIAGVGAGYRGVVEEDLSGLVLTPGFLDGHCHVESTMLTPAGFSELTAVRGTTGVAADPHEIANTCGMAGVEYMWRESLDCPIDLLFSAPSCVPASSFESPLEPLDACAMLEMFDRGLCSSLGEVMNYPGVIGGDPAVWAKLYASGRRPRSGHAPGLIGRDLSLTLEGFPAVVRFRCFSRHGERK